MSITKWEIEQYHIDHFSDDGGTWEEAQKMANEGWELVSVCLRYGKHPEAPIEVVRGYSLFFKKPLDEKNESTMA